MSDQAGGSGSQGAPSGVGGRPAESVTAVSAVLVAVVTQIVRGDNVDEEVLTGFVVFIGLLPAAITWLVEHGKKWETGASASAHPLSTTSTTTVPAVDLAYTTERAILKQRLGDDSWKADLEAVRAFQSESSPRQPPPAAGPPPPARSHSPPAVGAPSPPTRHPVPPAGMEP